MLLWSHYSLAEGYRKRTSQLSCVPMDFTYLIRLNSIQAVQHLHPLAAQRKIKWLGTGAEIEAPKALRASASRGVENGEGVSPSPAD